MNRKHRKTSLCLGFLLGNACMLALLSILWSSSALLTLVDDHSQYPTLSSYSINHHYNDQGSEQKVLPADCQGLQGMRVLLLEVHLEGNLGDEMETLPLLQSLKDCHIHITAVLSSWLIKRDGYSPQSNEGVLGAGSVRQHALIDAIEMPGNWERLDRSSFDAVIMAPGPWRLCPDPSASSTNFDMEWPYNVDIFVAGSVLSQVDCPIPQQMIDRWKPSLVIVREPHSLRLVLPQTKLPVNSWSRGVIHTSNAARVFMSGDLSHGFPSAEASLRYWKKHYSSFARKMNAVFVRASDVDEAITIKGSMLSMKLLPNASTSTSTTAMEEVTLPMRSVIFATSSAVEDAAWIASFREQYRDHGLQDYQFATCETVEQLFALISVVRHVYTNRYHPGVAAHRYNTSFTLLNYPIESGKLLGLRELQQSYLSPELIRHTLHPKAISILREELKILQKKRGELRILKNYKQSPLQIQHNSRT